MLFLMYLLAVILATFYVVRQAPPQKGGYPLFFKLFSASFFAVIAWAGVHKAYRAFGEGRTRLVGRSITDVVAERGDPFFWMAIVQYFAVGVIGLSIMSIILLAPGKKKGRRRKRR